jgi:hypothetical protein
MAVFIATAAGSVGAFPQSTRDSSLQSQGPQSRDRYGHICIGEVHGIAAPLVTAATTLYEHTVTMQNSCFKKLRIRLCYKGTDRCKVAELPSGERTRIVLGFSPNETSFMFEYREVPGYVE